MFLGTPRRWWFAAAVPLGLAFGLLASGDGTVVRTAVAVVLLIVATVLFWDGADALWAECANIAGANH